MEKRITPKPMHWNFGYTSDRCVIRRKNNRRNTQCVFLIMKRTSNKPHVIGQTFYDMNKMTNGKFMPLCLRCNPN